MERRQAIFEAAYAVMAEKGYKGTSMLAVAKAAGASNETLYNWFGNKQGLFAAMIEENARTASQELHATVEGDAAPLKVLVRFGDRLLELLNGEKSITLNRAAAADVSQGGVLGKLLADNGRRKVVPLITQTFAMAQEKGMIRRHDPGEIAEIYVSLLLGDLQIRRVIGVTAAPSPEATAMHSQRVVELIVDLFGVQR